MPRISARLSSVRVTAFTPKADSGGLLGRINRSLEFLWLLTVILVPLAFLGRENGEWSSIIGSYELPKITILRSLAGIIAILWLLEWALRSGAVSSEGSMRRLLNIHPRRWPQALFRWLADQPVRWLMLAVILFIGSTLLSTALSTSRSVSLWGDVPGQDSYSAYTVVSFGVLFAVIATHLKTEVQLWRLMGALVMMGILAGGYAVFQHYGWDFLDLIEPFGHTRSTSTFGNTVFAGSVLLMTIPVTVVVASRALTSNLTVTDFALRAAGGAAVLSLQILGTIFIASRGPWIGTLAGLAALLALLAVYAGWRSLARAALVLAFGALLSVIILVSPLQSVADEKAAERQAENPQLGQFRSLGAAQVTERLTSVGTQVIQGGLSGRKQIWGNAWELITARPWFNFDELSLSSIRPIIGYGPDQFRTSYLLTSPPNPAQNLLPNEVAHAHNFFLHQGVETGWLGIFTSAGIFIAVFASGSYFWIRKRHDLSGLHKLVIAGLIATLLGRLLEQLVGVARVSDLLVFWVLLAAFAALPVIFTAPLATDNAGQRPRQVRRESTKPEPKSSFYRQTVYLKWLVVVGLVVGIGLLTWTRNIDYIRAAVIADNAAEEFRVGEFGDALSSVDQSIDLSRGVSTYYNIRSEVSRALLSAASVNDCGSTEEFPDQRSCLAQQAYTSNTQWLAQRPFDFRARLALADSATELHQLSNEPHLQAQAARLYREAAEMVPNSLALWNRVGEVLIGLEQPDGALDALDKSLAITGLSSAHSVEALRFKGIAYRHLGQYQDSIRSLDQALSVNPGYGPAILERSLTYYQTGQTNRALEDLTVGLQLNPQSADGYQTRGTIYYELGRLQTAVNDLTQAINLEPQRSLAWNNRGLALAAMEDLDSAVEDFSEAIRLNPEFAEAYNNRGFVYRDSGLLEAAKEDLDKATELDPGFAIAYFNRALVNALLGNEPAAKQDGERAVSLGFDPVALNTAMDELKNLGQ